MGSHANPSSRLVLELATKGVTIDQVAIPEVSLADWRRRISELYAFVRAEKDSAHAWRQWYQVRSHLYAQHPMSPIPEVARANYSTIPVFDYDPAWRLLVVLTPLADQAPITVNVGNDGTLTRRAIATTDGLAPACGKELTVYWLEGYGGGLFLPFQDATSGHSSYGGGRYLLDSIKGADLGSDTTGSQAGRLVLDFNFAYHPSCFHNPAYVCPLAPAENRLPVAIEAGERL